MDNLTKAETREELLTQLNNGQAEKPPELIEHAKPRQSVDGMIARWTSDTPLVHTNLACEGPAGRVLYSNIMNQSDHEMADMLGKILEVVGFAVHAFTGASLEDGELKEMERLVLVLENGETVSTCSGPFGNTFVALAKMAGAGKWDPPLLIQARAKKGKSGRTYYECREILRVIQTDVVITPAKPGKSSK